MRDRKLLVTMLVALAAALAPAAANARRSGFAFQPITVQRINLPSGIKSAGWPVFTHDGRHLLFYSTGTDTTGGSTGPGAETELWIVDTDGRDAHCLSCGLANDPTSNGEGEITPFPDGKRIFFGSVDQPGSSAYGVLDCEPSVANCASRKILPIDFSAAQPKVIPPGGAESTPQTDTGGDYAAKLSQDGQYVGFSDIRTDSIETMIVGKLELSGDEYIVTDPKVINPPGPSSASDKSVQDWSNGGALYEFKTFTHGGADATYVQVGGEAGGNPDVWSVNLKTGKRTRLTSNPDYDEDNAVSPNGSLLALWSNRTMHMTDWLDGLLPVRGFIDDPAAVLSLQLSSSNKRCHGPIWILPSTGDDDARLLGQPIVYYRVPHVFVTNNLTGWPQWSPNGTMLALNTTNNSPGSGYPAHAPFLLVAHFNAIKATQPIRAVSSEPGSWAVSPTQYHPDYGFDGTVTLRGLGGGTVTVVYGGSDGVLAGHWSETYDKYSDNGRDFVSGTISITSTTETGTLKSDLVMTGADTGSDHVNLTFGKGVTGHGASTYDGHTVTGPSPEQAAEGACPAIQPKEPRLRATATRLRDGDYRLKVTVSIANAGANEGDVATEPVDDATIKIGRTITHTNVLGEVIVAPHKARNATITAGDTLMQTSIRLSRRD
jgi:hypothetical protein